MPANPLKSLAKSCLAIVLLVHGIMSFGNDQQKAEKRLRRISAMAVDDIARGIVNQTMADVVHAKRIELMRQRRAMNLSYGSLFLAHQLTAAGAAMLDIALELQTGKDIFQIANERKVNWKLIADGAKQLNEKIDDNIYRHYLHQTSDQQIAATDKYASEKDIVRADSEVSAEELLSAREDYVVWKNRGSSPRGGRLDSQTESVANDTAETYKGSQRPHPFP